MEFPHVFFVGHNPPRFKKPITPLRIGRLLDALTFLTDAPNSDGAGAANGRYMPTPFVPQSICGPSRVKGQPDGMDGLETLSIDWMSQCEHLRHLTKTRPWTVAWPTRCRTPTIGSTCKLAMPPAANSRMPPQPAASRMERSCRSALAPRLSFVAPASRACGQPLVHPDGVIPSSRLGCCV